MNKKMISIAALIAIVGAGLHWFSMLGSENALFDRFPDIPKDVVVQAHRTMLKRTYAGQYSHIDMTDEACDQIFLDIVKELTK
jgi:hypothetical protein